MEQEQKIQQMQFIEQSLQSILMQKQAFQMEFSETVEALKELDNSGDEVYKIIGQLMIKVSKETIRKDLESKEKLLKTRLDALGKQELSLTEQSSKLRNELTNSIGEKK